MVAAVDQVSIDMRRNGRVLADASEIFGAAHEPVVDDHLPRFIVIVLNGELDGVELKPLHEELHS